jgi:hypothetical protein
MIDKLDRLARQLHACCADGISCEECDQVMECVTFWDARVCSMDTITPRAYAGYSTQLRQFRVEKRR